MGLLKSDKALSARLLMNVVFIQSFAPYAYCHLHLVISTNKLPPEVGGQSRPRPLPKY
jgi:hypothetical protein